MNRISAFIAISILPILVRGEDVEVDRLNAIRALAAQAPTLETIAGPAAPKYQVIRLNSAPLEHDGKRYGVVRFKLPPSDPYTLVVAFSDVGNIDEYEIMPAAKGAMPVRGNTRLIYPALAHHDHEEGTEFADVTLPKPWDHCELHLLGFAPSLLKPGEEYFIWFRFSDKQPADILMAATLLKDPVDIAPEKLPAIFALPKQEEE